MVIVSTPLARVNERRSSPRSASPLSPHALLSLAGPACSSALVTELVVRHAPVTMHDSESACQLSRGGRRAAESRASVLRAATLACVVLASFARSQAQEQVDSIIQTVMGGSLGDGGPALSAPVYYPGNLAFVSTFTGVRGQPYQVTLYITEPQRHRVRRVDESGVITTIAGLGYAGFRGDGGPAAAAAFNTPTGIAAAQNSTDSTRVVCIADENNNRVRCFPDAPDTPRHARVVTTVAGDGSNGAMRNGVPATSTSLSRPRSVAMLVNVHSGRARLFIVDGWGVYVRQVDENGIITMYAGTGAGGSHDGSPALATSVRFSSINSVAAMDTPSGTGTLVWIGEGMHRRIYLVNESSVLTTVAGTGAATGLSFNVPAASSALQTPTQLAPVWNETCNCTRLYFADRDNQRVAMVDEAGIMREVAGGGSIALMNDVLPHTAKFFNPEGVAVSYDDVSRGSTVWISDTGHCAVRTVREDGWMGTQAGGVWRDGQPAIEASLLAPTSVVIPTPIGTGPRPAPSVWVAEYENHRIRAMYADGVMRTVAGVGVRGVSADATLASAAYLSNPADVAVLYNTTSGAYSYWIANRGAARVVRVNEEGGLVAVAGSGTLGYNGEGLPALSANLNFPRAVAVLHNETSDAVSVFIADTENHRIRVVDGVGKLRTVAGTSGVGGFGGDNRLAVLAQLNGPHDVVVLRDVTTGAPLIWIADTRNSV
ncbi:hypothetical protein EON62_02205, partial [archaeon]